MAIDKFCREGPLILVCCYNRPELFYHRTPSPLNLLPYEAYKIFFGFPSNKVHVFADGLLKKLVKNFRLLLKTFTSKNALTALLVFETSKAYFPFSTNCFGFLNGICRISTAINEDKVAKYEPTTNNAIKRIVYIKIRRESSDNVGLPSWLVKQSSGVNILLVNSKFLVEGWDNCNDTNIIPEEMIVIKSIIQTDVSNGWMKKSLCLELTGLRMNQFKLKTSKFLVG